MFDQCNFINIFKQNLPYELKLLILEILEDEYLLMWYDKICCDKCGYGNYGLDITNENVFCYVDKYDELGYILAIAYKELAKNILKNNNYKSYYIYLNKVLPEYKKKFYKYLIGCNNLSIMYSLSNFCPLSNCVIENSYTCTKYQYVLYKLLDLLKLDDVYLNKKIQSLINLEIYVITDFYGKLLIGMLYGEKYFNYIIKYHYSYTGLIWVVLDIRCFNYCLNYIKSRNIANCIDYDNLLYSCTEMIDIIKKHNIPTKARKNIFIILDYIVEYNKKLSKIKSTYTWEKLHILCHSDI